MGLNVIQKQHERAWFPKNKYRDFKDEDEK